MWLDAEAAVATGQEYRIGTRSLRRVDLKDIREQMLFWNRQVEQLQSGRQGMRVMRVVPRDL
ncbi:hypothetical protein EHS13_13710 [Paenibacillus psychroresistens]|uniref:Uncharacterized protein n=2 Tax=Paenibacillus psychroresistens TaxID=1778678 RepID=A0A6B8RWE0_9BACL|nr:hypothetical protein EHS13_13710 [Paenibacillus psychroresistens]